MDVWTLGGRFREKTTSQCLRDIDAGPPARQNAVAIVVASLHGGGRLRRLLRVDDLEHRRARPRRGPARHANHGAELSARDRPGRAGASQPLFADVPALPRARAARRRRGRAAARRALVGARRARRLQGADDGLSGVARRSRHPGALVFSRRRPAAAHRLLPPGAPRGRDHGVGAAERAALRVGGARASARPRASRTARRFGSRRTRSRRARPR